MGSRHDRNGLCSVTRREHVTYKNPHESPEADAVASSERIQPKKDPPTPLPSQAKETSNREGRGAQEQPRQSCRVGQSDGCMTYI